MLVTTWAVAEPRGSVRTTLVAIDTATGERRVLADDDNHEYLAVAISPDGTKVATVRGIRSTPYRPR